MARSDLEKVRVYIKIYNGYDENYNSKYAYIPIKKLSRTDFDADKVLNIVGALESCLNNEIDSIQKIEVSNLFFA